MLKQWIRQWLEVEPTTMEASASRAFPMDPDTFDRMMLELIAAQAYREGRFVPDKSKWLH